MIFADGQHTFGLKGGIYTKDRFNRIKCFLVSQFMIGDRKIIAMCVADIRNEDTQSMIYSMHKILLENNCNLAIYSCTTDLYHFSAFDRGEAAVFRLINYEITDAVLICGNTIKNDDVIRNIVSDAVKYGKPVFVIDNPTEFEGASSVVFSECNAFRQLVTHLVEDHHFTRFGCIAGFKGNDVSERRVAIFRSVLENHGIPFSEKNLGYGDFYSFPTRKVMQRFLRDPDGLPEAIVCINDSMAITVCEVLAENGISVPETVTVTGFDGIEQERYNYPRITTCRRDMVKFAEFMCDTLYDIFNGGEIRRIYTFPYTLSISESCGCFPRSVSGINKSINLLYNRLNNIMQYDRSMINMVTKITGLNAFEDVNKTLKYYVQFNSYICVNSDFLTGSVGEHTYEHEPFTENVISRKFFYGENFITVKEFPPSKLVPDTESLVSLSAGPVIVLSIHNQENVYGFMTAFSVDSDISAFEESVQRIQCFSVNLDNCMSMYIQQNNLRKYNSRLRELQNKIIISFADLVESRDDFTGQHIKRTSQYLKILVEHLSHRSLYADILTKDMCEIMAMAAPLHDIGKIKISDAILNKPGRLTNEEFEIIKTHALEGSKIITRTLTDIEDGDYLQIARDMALYHHEKWDGSGYPCHLSGEEIPLCARIMAVVDVFDALISKRVYKEAYSVDKAFSILSESIGSHFDPNIAEGFISIRPKIENVLKEYTK